MIRSLDMLWEMFHCISQKINWGGGLVKVQYNNNCMLVGYGSYVSSYVRKVRLVMYFICIVTFILQIPTLLCMLLLHIQTHAVTYAH